MLRVRRIPTLVRPGLQSFLPNAPNWTQGAQRLSRFQHHDSHARTAKTDAPKHPTAGTLAHDRDASFSEFSDMITTLDHDSHSSKSKVKEDEDIIQQQDAGDTEGDHPIQESPFRKSLDQILSVFLPSRARSNKIDLSNISAQKWEAIMWEDDPSELPLSVPVFRSTHRLRGLLLDYLQNIEPYLNGSSDEDSLLAALRSTFSDESLDALKIVDNKPTDVVSWAWIFSSKNINLAIARYIMLAKEARESGHGGLPKFVSLQLLRADAISPYFLKEFITSILADLQKCLDAGEFAHWNWSARVCLVVRLLRHARRVAPECFVDIARIVKYLFADYYVAHPQSLHDHGLVRLSHFCNRILSLVSLAPLQSPYNSYLFQQRAQLALVQMMSSFEPQIPITREGYRALIAVQLLHRKTSGERAWAATKSLSWPPWRRIKMGIEQDIEYPGKNSRVTNLLRKMQEAGYMFSDWEKSAAILAGWDLDKSPTIQTRAILKRQSRPWLLLQQDEDEFISRQGSNAAAEVWTARIRATRTTREAWACFCSYERSTKTEKAHYLPYFTMLQRLLNSVVHRDDTFAWKYQAGDLKESFEDSQNPREVIYIDTEMPSADEFYEQMLRAGIRPGGALLASLLNHSTSVKMGFRYIQDCGWDEVTKDVLRHAGKYPTLTIRDSLRKLPTPTLAAFISLLSKSMFVDTLEFRDLGAEDVVTGIRDTMRSRVCSPLRYAKQLLVVAGICETRVWNALLEGAYEGCRKQLAHKRQDRASMWRGLRLTLWPTRVGMDAVFDPDLETFRLHAKLLELAIYYGDDYYMNPDYLGLFTKKAFMQSIYGRPMDPVFPEGDQSFLAMPGTKDLKRIVRVLASTRDAEGLVAFVKWINENARRLELAQGQASHAASGGERGEGMATQDEETLPPLRELLCAARLFLERRSDEVTKVADADDVAFEVVSPFATDSPAILEAEKHCQILGWPSDDELYVFLRDNGKWVEQVTHAAEAMAHSSIGREKPQPRSLVRRHLSAGSQSG